LACAESYRGRPRSCARSWCRVGQQELCRIEAEAAIGEAMGNLDLGVPFPPLQLPRAGTYQVDLRVGGRLLATRQLLVQEQTP